MIIEISKKETIHHVGDHVLRMADYILQFYRLKYGFDVVNPEFKDINNITTKLDQQIHADYVAELSKVWGDDIDILGEENKPKKKKWQPTRGKLVVSIDAVDGTDLVVKGLNNWCTALFFFSPGKQIESSFVGFPGILYFASPNGAYKLYEIDSKRKNRIEQKRRARKLKINLKNRTTDIRNVSVCVYGQKAGRLLSILENDKFVGLLKCLKKESEKPQHKRDGNRPVNFRIYNLAGNPMIIKLIEGSIDIVFDLMGQKLYDVLPAAYIAQKAGAFWGDLEGNEISEKYLFDKCLHDPENAKLNYIIASSEGLYREVLKHV